MAGSIQKNTRNWIKILDLQRPPLKYLVTVCNFCENSMLFFSLAKNNTFTFPFSSRFLIFTGFTLTYTNLLRIALEYFFALWPVMHILSAVM
jgi:hypothetical protein